VDGANWKIHRWKEGIGARHLTWRRHVPCLARKKESAMDFTVAIFGNPY